MLRLLRLVKLVRIVRASRLFKRWESQIDVQYAFLSLLKVNKKSDTLFCVWTKQTHTTRTPRLNLKP